MISIAMATYNGGKYVQLQLDSILQQTLQDFEIIVCDDCSTDNTVEILQQNAAKDPRIKVHRNETNLGFKNNFEKAMQLCSGEFIALCDQDDIWEKDHLETLLNLIGNHDIACGDAHLIGSNGEDLGQNLSDRDFMEVAPNPGLDTAYRVFFNSSCFQGASMLVRRDFLKTALPIPENVKYHDAWFAAISSFMNGLKFTFKIVTQHRRHETNASVPLKWKKIGPINIRRAPRLLDRLFWLDAIQERLSDFNADQQKFLKSAKKYYTNRLAKSRKLKNFFFRLPHYKKIYTTRSKIYLEW